jgi:hypothetical protein
MQKYNLQKKSSKRSQNAPRYHNSITKSQVSTQAKISSFKNPHIKIDLLLLPRGQNPLKLLYLTTKKLVPHQVGEKFLAPRDLYWKFL